ncbi:MAG: glucosidase [Planctomycetes bacterium]|nr:glucosidase [Planctomycetota bacterium]
MTTTAEELRLVESRDRTANWQRWGPYLAERQWGTVREDYSEDGECWEYFPHEHARSRAYRWGEDGLLGLCDRQCRLCFAVALWNGHDAVLKERLFGLTGPQGNHGEDVKECYFYLDSTPTHSYLRALYKYPQVPFPYERLIQENRRRGRHEPEFELADTGIFDGNLYFDVFVEYAKASPDDILIRLTLANRGPHSAVLHVLPTLWFRNTWSWGCTHEGCEVKPRMHVDTVPVSPSARGGTSASPPLTKGWQGGVAVIARHPSLGAYRFCAETGPHSPPTLLFTENETNIQRLYGSPNETPFVKDAFHDYVIGGQADAVNPQQAGTKAAAHYVLEVPAGGEACLRLRLAPLDEFPPEPFGVGFEHIFERRRREADDFYAARLPYLQSLSDEERLVARQAYAGLLWTKQFYHYVVPDWLEGDPEQPPPPAARKHRARNRDWPHLFNRDILSMPDKWEYPWYAAWDLAFHMVAFARVDAEFAKAQLDLLLREWYMHPNGQIPAYEWQFSDVNPPVHAWACWRVYKITGPRGHRDRQFLVRVFTKLLVNFTWWVNRKDIDGKHLFAGGFLGLDNIGVFDRSKPLPTGGHLEQADGTAWMAFYCGVMLAMSLELAEHDPAYEDIASKFFEHFVHIVDAMNCLGGTGLWDEGDGFFYDQLHIDGRTTRLAIRSVVGLIPLFAVEVLDDERLHRLPGFRKRMEWFLRYRGDLARHISYLESSQSGGNHRRRLLAVPSRERLVRVLPYLLDEDEFLSDYGVRAMSRVHREKPYVFHAGGEEHRVEYVPGESNTGLFGGNSNWRGPIWFPVNYLLIEALRRYHYFYREDLKVECPTGSGRLMNLAEVADEISRRLVRLFVPDSAGRRPCHGDESRYAHDPHWRELVLFYEYFHGDTGRGVGASHQTGWTALVTEILRSLVTR